MKRWHGERTCKVLSVAGLMAAGAGCAQTFSSTAAWLGPASAETTEVGAASLLEVRIRQGTLRFEGVNAEPVSYEVRVGPARGALGVPKSCAYDGEQAVQVRAERAGEALRLRVDPTPGDGCVEDWVVQLPRGLAVSARLDAGSIIVSGAEQSLRLEAGAGSIEVTGATGAVEAKTGVGSIRVAHVGNHGGSVWLRTNVGHVDLFVNGRKLQRSRAPGSGDHVALEGEARPRIRLTSNVGDIELKLASDRP